MDPFPDTGYGNYLYAMTSSLVIAILTDSALIIQWPGISKFVDEPLLKTFENFTQSNEFNTEYQNNTIYQVPLHQCWQAKKNYRGLINTEIPLEKSRYQFKHWAAYFLELCSNPIYWNKLKYYGLVNNLTIDSAKNALSKYSYSDEAKTNAVLQVGYEVGGNLINKIWIPKKEIRDLVGFYLNKHFKGYYMIGIQIRYIYLNELDDTDTFIKCARHIENEFYQNDLINKKKYKNGVKWFIASDNEDYLKKLKLKYSNKAIVANGTIGFVEYKDMSGYKKAILDVELLSRCNKLIITGGSTFGMVAAFKMLKMPYFINGNIKMDSCKLINLSKPPVRTDKNIY